MTPEGTVSPAAGFQPELLGCSVIASGWALSRVFMGVQKTPVAKIAAGLALSAFVVLSAAALAQNAPADAVGEWMVAKQIARIRIADCGGRLWGVVSWEARAGTDKKNPDPQLRGRPTLGMPVLLGMAQTKANKWEGKIYNSEDGNTYSANITLLDPGTLKVQGCFLGFLCGGENWTRVEPETSGRVQTSGRGNRRNVRSAEDEVCESLSGSPRLPH